jgi:hypothetical protein
MFRSPVQTWRKSTPEETEKPGCALPPTASQCRSARNVMLTACQRTIHLDLVELLAAQTQELCHYALYLMSSLRNSSASATLETTRPGWVMAANTRGSGCAKANRFQVARGKSEQEMIDSACQMQLQAAATACSLSHQWTDLSYCCPLFFLNSSP